MRRKDRQYALFRVRILPALRSLWLQGGSRRRTPHPSGVRCARACTGSRVTGSLPLQSSASVQWTRQVELSERVRPPWRKVTFFIVRPPSENPGSL